MKVIVVNENNFEGKVMLQYENVVYKTIVQRLGWTAELEYLPHLDGAVARIKDWIGGEGDKPIKNIGDYIGSEGFVVNIDDATVFGRKGDEGEKGEKGDQGIQGEKGETGDQGIQGDKPQITIGVNDHWFVDGVDTGKVASSKGGLDTVYGVQYNTTHATPALERIGIDMFNHATLPVQSKFRRCIANVDRTVNYYLHPEDSTLKEDGTPADLSGADGQFALHTPDLYLCFSTGGNMRRIQTSLHPFMGAKFFESRLISVSHATVQRSTNKLMCVVNNDPDFAGGGTGVNIYNGTARTAASRAAFRTYARNLGHGWELYDYTTDLMLYWLYIIEYANFNSQLAFNAERTPEGYMQGGLGAGVTNAASAAWLEYNNRYPFVPIGYTADLGNKTGTKELVIPDFGGSEFVTQVPSYRGLENPFGHIFTILEGIQSFFKTDESFDTYVTDNPALYNDDDHDGFRYVGSLPLQAGYITEWHFGEHGDIVTKSNTGGSSTTFMCDYQYVPTATDEYKWNAKCGHADGGAIAGVGCVYSATRVSNAVAAFGVRLCAKTKTENEEI